MLVRERSCQQNVVSTPQCGPRCPKRKPEITGLDRSRTKSTRRPALSPESLGRASRGFSDQGIRANDYSAERRHRDGSRATGLQFWARHSITAEAVVEA